MLLNLGLLCRSLLAILDLAIERFVRVQVQL
jgi:hypothetical protein